MLSGLAREITTDCVCGNEFASNKKSFDFNFVVLFARAIASAAAVGSSSNDAFEISKPVKS